MMIQISIVVRKLNSLWIYQFVEKQLWCVWHTEFIKDRRKKDDLLYCVVIKKR